MKSPGRRQFSPDAMGTHQDWNKVARMPHVKRMLQDPAIMQALYQNWRGTGGQMPSPMQGLAGQAPSQGMGGMAPSQGTPGQPPIPMQEGGAVPSPEDVNRLQQIRSGDVDPATADQLEELGREAKPLRFQTGGANESAADLDAEVTQAFNDLQKATQSSNPEAIRAAQQKYLDLSKKRAQATMSQNQPAAPMSVGNTQISSGTMGGLKNLAKMGPPTLGNMGANILVGGLMGGAGTGSAAGALIGAGTAGLLNFFLRKQGAQRKKQQEQQYGGDGGGGGGNYSQDQSQQPGSYSGSGSASPGAPAPNPGAGNAPLAAPLKPGEGLAYGSANVTGGRVVSRDGGKTWTNPNARPNEDSTVDPSKVKIENQGDVILPSQPQAAQQSQAPPAQDSQPWGSVASVPTGLGAMESGQPGLPDLSAAEYDLTGADNMAHGGPVPHKHGIAAIPVLHIAIMAKPKDKPPLKRAMGGEIPQAERRPRKPAAVPPTGGPNPFGLQSGARQPHGRVQVPKGSGIAIKGKRFGGIY